MVNIQESFENEQLKSVMILQVHDELNFDVHSDEISRVKQIVKEKMEDAVQLRVPLTIDMGEGANWLEAH